jgi:hypothetical protein
VAQRTTGHLNAPHLIELFPIDEVANLRLLSRTDSINLLTAHRNHRLRPRIIVIQLAACNLQSHASSLLRSWRPFNTDCVEPANIGEGLSLPFI